MDRAALLRRARCGFNSRCEDCESLTRSSRPELTRKLGIGGSALAASRYPPAEVATVRKTIVQGLPDVNRITTSHVEKQNHTPPMHCRRLTRLTNALSKKLDNFKAAVALNFSYCNFCKIHLALRTTPAQAAGIDQGIWTVPELVERCGE